VKTKLCAKIKRILASFIIEMVKERSPLFHIICLVVDVVHVVGLNNAPYLCLCYVVALLLMDNIFLYMEL
jgi:hypothetical protein